MQEKPVSSNTNKDDFFEGNHLYIYLYKKAEKLASALYVVTNLIDSKEVLRSLLREKSINIFSEVMQLQKMSLTNHNALKKDVDTKVEHVSSDTLLSGITEIVSLLEIARVSRHISEMNFSVLEREYIDLGILIKTKREDIAPDNVQLPKEFFDVPNLYETRVLKQSSIKDTKHTQKIYKTKKEKQIPIKDTLDSVTKPKDIIHPKTADIRHNNRRNTILELLQDKPSVTVKDVINEIQGCSSKTLQRELLSLVNEGILKKEGERRWSTYSLA